MALDLTEAREKMVADQLEQRGITDARAVATIAEVVRQNGYAASAFGKWHNTPDWETSPIGPFDRWPTGLGFEYWYGFQGGETSQWEPQLFRNTLPVLPATFPNRTFINRVLPCLAKSCISSSVIRLVHPM